MPPAKIEAIITNLTGVATRIEENTGKNKFTVVCKGYITPEIMKAVRRELNKLKPSHLIYQIISSIFYDASAMQYQAAAAGILKIYEVKEVA